jgi:teichuronic acid exporter
MADLVSESPPPVSAPPPAAGLDRSLLRGIAWTGGAKWATQLLGWSSTLLVANLLGPDPYGLIGMASVFLGLVSTLTEFGLGTAIISLRKLSAEQNRQLNTIALALGVVGALLTCAAAWPLGWIYREKQLPMIIVAMSSTFVLSALRIVPTAQLQRDLLFRRLAILETLQSVVFAIANVVFALLGFGVWTLVIGAVVSQTVGTILTWMARPERFAWPRRDSLGGALQFSSHVLISRLAWYLYTNADFAVAGLVFGKSVLGAYTLAWQFASIPIDKISAMIARVTPAYFAAAQDDNRTMRGILLNITEGLAFLTLPATFGLALVAPEFVRLILGPEWSAAIVPLQLLSIYASYRSLGHRPPPGPDGEGGHEVDDVARRVDGGRAPHRLPHRESLWSGGDRGRVDHRVSDLHDPAVQAHVRGDPAGTGTVPARALAVAAWGAGDGGRRAGRAHPPAAGDAECVAHRCAGGDRGGGVRCGDRLSAVGAHEAPAGERARYRGRRRGRCGGGGRGDGG